MFFFGKKAAKVPAEREIGLGPWFLARDFPISDRISYGIWKERFCAAEFAVANHFLSGYRPGVDEIQAIAAHVQGSDSLPQARDGVCAATYRLALGSFFDGGLIKWEDPEPASISEKFRNASREIYGRPCLPDAVFLEKARIFLIACDALKPEYLNWKAANVLRILYKEMEMNRTSIEGGLTPELLRLFARQALLRAGILLRWEIWAYDQGMYDQFRKNPGFVPQFRTMMEAVDF